MTVISRWRLRGNALDSVGSNNGTAVGVTWGTTGPTGANASFAGNTGSYVTIPDADAFSSTTQTFTLALFGNFQNPASTGMSLVTKGQLSNYEWGVTSTVNKINALKYTFGGASGYSSLGSVNTLVANKWTHIIASWNNTYPVIYVNGVPSPSTTYNTATPVANNGIAPVMFGKRADNIGPMLGKLADVVYRNSFMSNAQVKNEYMQTKGLFS